MKEKKQNIRIEKISIRNYRGIEKLDLDFNLPQMPEDPDITILGSKNGVGKTSVLECCAWLILGATDSSNIVNNELFLSKLVSTGYKKAEISGKIYLNNTSNNIVVSLSIDGRITLLNRNNTNSVSKIFESADKLSIFESILSGENSNPLISNTYIFLHSYRKVQEGDIELGMTIEDGRSMQPSTFRGNVIISSFKKMILKALMTEANLFEDSNKAKPQETKDMIAVLNKLLSSYANVKIGKLKPLENNTIDIRVESLTTGKTYSFDGLSSGQKEIISTLFMIWSNTRDNPAVVLIDEPELHLNVEWHKNFIKKLVELAPKNQYIIATHSEDIMASVDKSRRILLTE
jgi:predicted ATP-binding protein involved in virulence